MTFDSKRRNPALIGVTEERGGDGNDEPHRVLTNISTCDICGELHVDKPCNSAVYAGIDAAHNRAQDDDLHPHNLADELRRCIPERIDAGSQQLVQTIVLASAVFLTGCEAVATGAGKAVGWLGVDSGGITPGSPVDHVVHGLLSGWLGPIGAVVGTAVIGLGAVKGRKALKNRKQRNAIAKEVLSGGTPPM